MRNASQITLQRFPRLVAVTGLPIFPTAWQQVDDKSYATNEAIERCQARVKIQREIIESLDGVATGRFQSRQFLFEEASTVKCDRDARGYLRGKMSQEVGVHLNSPELLRIYIAIPRRRNEMSFRKTLAIAF